MPNRIFRARFWALLLSLSISTQACIAVRNPVPAPTQSPQFATATPTGMPASFVNTPAPLENTSTPVASPTNPTPAIVTVTAVYGNLAIRTGPDMVFDAIAELHEGETVPALARSILDGWVQVPIPSQPGKAGWVSLRTGYSSVSGYVLDLPLVETVEWPFGAYLLNCTSHQMLVEPTDKTLPSVNDAPQNRVWFPPGYYAVYDLDVAGRPEVTHVKLWEHTEVHLRKDGSGQKWDCP